MSCSGKKINIILIVSDTFRNDLLMEEFEVKNGRRAKVPKIKKLAEESILFSRAYCASFPTVPNRHDLLTGKYTFTYSNWAPLPKEEVVLPQILKKLGYVSMLIGDTPHIFKDGFNYDRGFDGWIWIRGQEDDRFRTDPEKIVLPCKPEKLRNVETTIQHMRNNALRVFEEDWIPAKTSNAAIRWLEKNYNRNFFLYVDFFDPHEPWDPPEYYVERYDPNYEGEKVIYPMYGPSDYLTKEELEHCRAMYAGEATLVDKWIGMILEKVEELGLWENTAMIFTSDHGFYLGEHKLIGKSIIMGNIHGLSPLYEEVAHIPLVLRLPERMMNSKKGLKIDELVQTPDITATILELVGSDYRVGGSSLLPLIKRESSGWREFAISTPSLVHGARGGLRPTITSKDWSLILSSFEEQADEKEYTMIVDGKPRVLKPLGRIDTELFNLKYDKRQEKNLIEDYKEVAIDLKEKFIEMLRKLNTKEEFIKPWLKCRRIDS
ncbi:MAG: sulfatase [Thermoproteota archaeon]|nr:sulfatase [Candidatus Brockarchaeota archaeon]